MDAKIAPQGVIIASDFTQLADKAIVSLNAITRLERGEVDPRVSTLEAVEKAIRKAGVEFISADDRRGVGVRLTKP